MPEAARRRFLELTAPKEPASHVAILMKATGLLQWEVEIALGNLFTYSISASCKDARDRTDREIKALSVVARAAREARDRFDALSFDLTKYMERPDFEALIEGLEDELGRLERDRKNWPKGEKITQALTVARGVARVFKRAGLPLHVGERGDKPGEPAGPFPCAVRDLMEDLRVPGHWRRPAEAARRDYEGK